MVKYRSFRIGDIFDIATGRDIIISKTNPGNVPLISHQHDNNGITKYIKRIKNRRLFNAKDTIALADRGVFYATTQDKDFHIGTRVKALTFKDGAKSLNVRLFFTTAINKLQILFTEYLNNATDKLPDLKIQLPVTHDDKIIDYNYMERLINEFKEEPIDELEAYLNVMGFNNYILTTEEQEALDRYRKGEVKYEKFKIGDLFDIHPTKSYGYTNRILFKEEGSVPVVVNSSVNNGIGGYVNLKPTENGNMITFSDTTTSESIFYQPHDFIGYSHIQGLYPKNDINWSENALLYFLTLFKQQAAGRFDYANKFNRNLAMEMIVMLPVTQSSEIDLSFINHFIRAQEKLSVKGAVDWKDEIKK